MKTLVSNLMRDARTTRRWYLVVAMGRTAGHLALGMGLTGGAPLTIIPEELHGRNVTLDAICDMVEGAMCKSKLLGPRLRRGRRLPKAWAIW